MKERLRDLYYHRKITEDGLQFWVNKGVIFQADMDEIIAGGQEPV